MAYHYCLEDHSSFLIRRVLNIFSLFPKGAVAISNSPEFNMRIVKPGPVKSPGFVVKFKYDQTLNLTREL